MGDAALPTGQTAGEPSKGAGEPGGGTSTTDQDRREDEHTARTGEVQTDALGNEDGGS